MIEGYGVFASLRQFIEVFFFFLCQNDTKIIFWVLFWWFLGMEKWVRWIFSLLFLSVFHYVVY